MSKGHIIIKNADPTKIISGSKASMHLLVQRCAEVLQRHYPKHMWSIQATDNSAVGIRALDIDTQYGVVIYTTTLQADPDLKCVMRAGGEILERAFITRTKGGSEETAKMIDLTGATRVRSADKKRTITKVR